MYLIRGLFAETFLFFWIKDKHLFDLPDHYYREHSFSEWIILDGDNRHGVAEFEPYPVSAQ
jgi:hypothetical protein